MGGNGGGFAKCSNYLLVKHNVNLFKSVIEGGGENGLKFVT